jgi:hypothetical protein
MMMISIWFWVLMAVMAGASWLALEFKLAPRVPPWRNMEHPSGTQCLKCGRSGLGMLEDCPNGCDDDPTRW